MEYCKVGRLEYWKIGKSENRNIIPPFQHPKRPLFPLLPPLKK